jgi:choline transport protein
VTIIVVVAMPKQHASHSFVWTDFQNSTGWGNGVAFLTGVLNGAFTIGTPDAITHMAEELPNPRKDLPKAVFCQIGLGTITAFVFAIAIMYGITDLGAVVTANGSFPLAAVYSQATGSAGATFGLLFILFLALLICLVGTFLTLSRIWWALARDNATPFSHFFSKVNRELSCPVPAMILVTVLCTALGAIGLGSKTAFSDLVGSFIILTTTSYVLAIAPHLLSGRNNVPRGWFWMGKWGFVVQGAAVLLTIFFNVMFCFRKYLLFRRIRTSKLISSPLAYANPTTVQLMNYNSVILVGCVVLTAIWWFIHGSTKYPGPKVAHLYLDGIEPK